MKENNDKMGYEKDAKALYEELAKKQIHVTSN